MSSRALDEALADLAAQTWEQCAPLPTADRWRETIMAAVRADRARRPTMAVRIAEKSPAPTVDEIRGAHEWKKALPFLRRAAAAHGMTVDILISARVDRAAVKARDEGAWLCSQGGMLVSSIGRVLGRHGSETGRAIKRHHARVDALAAGAGSRKAAAR